MNLILSYIVDVLWLIFLIIMAPIGAIVKVFQWLAATAIETALKGRTAPMGQLNQPMAWQAALWLRIHMFCFDVWKNIALWRLKLMVTTNGHQLRIQEKLGFKRY